MRGVEVHECESGVEPHVGVWRQMCVRGVWRQMCQKGVDCFLKRHRRGFCGYVLFVCVTFVCVTSVLLPLII